MKWISVLLVCLVTACVYEQSDQEKFKELLKKAEAGDAEAQAEVGIRYFDGQGVIKDEVEAVKWFRKAADQGDARAQNGLGVCYGKGKGVSKDYETGYMWYLLAGAQGSELARKNAGIVEKGLTPEQRANGQKRAREWQEAFDKAKEAKGN